MAATIPFNPFPSTFAASGMFGVQANGLRQGTVFPDPPVFSWKRTGILATDETLPMWGGVGIYMNIPGGTGAPNESLGVVVGRATGNTGSKALAGFSTFDSAYASVITPQSNVPLAASGMQVMTYPFGSRARLVVACDPILVSLWQDPIGSNVSWDYVNQRLIPYLGTLTITSGTYNDTTGIVTLTMAVTQAYSAGNAIIISSLTGTGAYASLNGTFTALTVVGTTVTYDAGAGLGASTITGGSLTLGSGASTALAAKVLDVQAANCMVVDYDADTGFANYDFDGAAAVIQI